MPSPFVGKAHFCAGSPWMRCPLPAPVLGDSPSLPSSGVPRPPHALDMLVFPGDCSPPTVFSSSRGLKNNSVLMTLKHCSVQASRLHMHLCIRNLTGISDSSRPVVIYLHQIYSPLLLQLVACDGIGTRLGTHVRQCRVICDDFFLDPHYSITVNPANFGSSKSLKSVSSIPTSPDLVRAYTSVT